MNEKLDQTAKIRFTIAEADSIEELAETIKEVESEGGSVKRVWALVVKTSKIPQGAE